MDGGEEDGKKESPFDDSVHAFVLGFVDGDILLGAREIYKLLNSVCKGIISILKNSK